MNDRLRSKPAVRSKPLSGPFSPLKAINGSNQMTNYIDYQQEERSIDLLDGDLATALEYWRSLSTDGRVPRWDEFDLMKLPLNLVGLTHVFDTIEGGKDFHCRFWGTKLAEIFGFDVTGRTAATMHPSQDFCQMVLKELNETTRSEKPRTTSTFVMNKNERVVCLEILRLPLTDKSGNVVHCITITVLKGDKDQIQKTHINKYHKTLN